MIVWLVMQECKGQASIVEIEDEAVSVQHSAISVQLAQLRVQGAITTTEAKARSKNVRYQLTHMER